MSSRFLSAGYLVLIIMCRLDHCGKRGDGIKSNRSRSEK